MVKTLVASVTARDCEWEFFRAGGPGGQNQNKRSMGVRVRHPPSGAVGVAREARSQYQNRRLAFRRMAESAAFRQWIRAVVRQAPSLEARVERAMSEPIQIEVRRGDQWVTVETVEERQPELPAEE